jgi:hypothetical protein
VQQLHASEASPNRKQHCRTTRHVQHLTSIADQQLHTTHPTKDQCLGR